MKEFKYTINDHLGIHARPAGMLVKEAARYQSSIMLDKDGKKGDAKRIFAVIILTNYYYVITFVRVLFKHFFRIIYTVVFKNNNIRRLKTFP